jgi:hypothetical protein
MASKEGLARFVNVELEFHGGGGGGRNPGTMSSLEHRSADFICSKHTTRFTEVAVWSS